MPQSHQNTGSSNPNLNHFLPFLFSHLSPSITSGPTLFKLFFCLLLDLIGNLSYLLPFLGEIFDLTCFAPIQAYFLYQMFGNSIRLAVFGFLEEVSPGFFDVMPTCTVAWCLERWDYVRQQEQQNSSENGNYSQIFSILKTLLGVSYQRPRAE